MNFAHRKILLLLSLVIATNTSFVLCWPSLSSERYFNTSIGEPKVLSLTANGTVDVSVEVESVTETIGGKAVTSGVYDLRLFRDGQLVGSTIPQAAIERYISAAPAAVESDLKSGKVIDTAEDALWREANDLFKVTSPNFKKISATKGVYTFHNIQLPRDGRKEVEFSAYAFNSDRVKSDTARTKYTLLEMPSATTQRKAYIVSIGVNRSDVGGDWTLSCAVSDAEVTQKALADRLKGQYDVVPVELTSSAETPSSAATRNAIKPNVRAVLELLSGVKPIADDLDSLKKSIGQPLLDKILRSTPQDLVIVTFSSHGVAHASGDFYLLPSDIRMTKPGQRIPDYDSMISSDELSLWMRDMDAADIVMIIDACHAAASVETPNFKPAPMGSRGLGQLAYDKQMRILTATRAKDIAVELKAGTQGVCQGLLTYALVHDGFELGLADTNKPKADGKIMFGEWLEFGRDDVPVVFKKWKSGDLPAAKGFKDKENADPAGFTQQPALFDFRRDKSRDVQIH
ncbi:MAG TPA: hypothetical protein VL501_06640 [Pyrinomonadaceae bacterium]|jgi:hypothetical protein|nr:hypothetical protein [Pyrinomonadaceae bacterium]